MVYPNVNLRRFFACSKPLEPYGVVEVKLHTDTQAHAHAHLNPTDVNTAGELHSLAASVPGI